MIGYLDTVKIRHKSLLKEYSDMAHLRFYENENILKVFFIRKC